MKRKTIITILAAVPMLLLGQERSVASLMQDADSIRNICVNLKTKDRIEGLEKALSLQDSVYYLLTDSVRSLSAYESDALAYHFFSCSDSSIFNQNYIIIDTLQIPRYLQEHFIAVTTIRQYAQCVDNMERKIEEAEADNDIAEDDRKNYVAIKIKSEIDKANDLFVIIDNLNMSSFSEEQIEYYKGLSSKFNNILRKYIF